MEKVDGWSPIKQFFKCPICGREFTDNEDAVSCKTSHPKVMSVVGWDDWQEVLPATIYVKMTDGRTLRYRFSGEEGKGIPKPFDQPFVVGQWR